MSSIDVKCSSCASVVDHCHHKHACCKDQAGSLCYIMSHIEKALKDTLRKKDQELCNTNSNSILTEEIIHKIVVAFFDKYRPEKTLADTNRAAADLKQYYHDQLGQYKHRKHAQPPNGQASTSRGAPEPANVHADAYDHARHQNSDATYMLPAGLAPAGDAEVCCSHWRASICMHTYMFFTLHSNSSSCSRRM